MNLFFFLTLKQLTAPESDAWLLCHSILFLNSPDSPSGKFILIVLVLKLYQLVGKVYQNFQ